jgi:tetratricopeptide (TPR) repeat protein
VGIVGEADARHLNHSTRAALDQTTIGHIARLEANLRAHDLDRADIELEQLRRAFPGWGLLIEAQALIALRRDDPEQSIRMVQEHLAGETGEPYLSATVGCAAAMELGEPGRALTVLGLVQAKRPLTSVEQRLRDALRLRAGHLDLLLAGGLRRTTEPRRGEMASADAYEIRVLANIGADYLVHARERSALDLQPADEVILRELLTALARWDERGAKMAEGDARSPFDELVRISEEEQISDAMFARLGALAADADGETIESIGFFVLVGGRARDAVESLERAVRMRPRSSRAHWALAVGSWLWGWEDKAQESLERAVALDPEDLLLVATRRRFLASASEVQETLDLVAESNEWSAIQTVQLALLGIGLAPAKVSDSSTPHERFHARVTAMALASTLDDAVSTGD